MTRYSVQPRDRIFVKGYRFLSFAKNVGKNIGKNISKNVSGKFSQKLLHHAKKSATDAPKKTAEATGGLIGNKIANKARVVPKNLQQNNSETVTNKHDKEVPKERYVCLEEDKKLLRN